MLLHFLGNHRGQILEKARARAFARKAPAADPAELEKGIPLFFDQLVSILEGRSLPKELKSDAAFHGGEMLRQGFTVAQLVHDYGDLCQAITETAMASGEEIPAEDYKTLNACLDDATAWAVTEFVSRHDNVATHDEAERLGRLAHEQRNLLNGALLAFQVLRNGSVGIAGSTGAVLGRSLMGLRDLINRSLAEVRVGAGITNVGTVELASFIEEMEVSATLEARERDMHLTVLPGAFGVKMRADRQLLAGAVANLMSNAFKFTREGGRIELRSVVTPELVTIEVEDECGGLPHGVAGQGFAPFEQRSHDRSGLGLGLSIARQGLTSFGATLSVLDRPGKGCVFAIGVQRETAED